MDSTLDHHGQPLPTFASARRTERAIHEMLGLCKAFILDGIVTPEEAAYLERWISANPDVTQDFVGATLADRLSRIFADGRVDLEEQNDLAELLSQIVGGELSVVAGENAATTLPLDRPTPPIRFDGQVYVFTGKFAFGPREACQRTVIELGGRCEPGVTRRTNVLVIGSFGSRDWAQSSYGRKIEKAVQYRESGLPLAIVGENHWAAALA